MNWILPALLLALSSTGPFTAEADVPEVWRAWLDVPGGELPFGLEFIGDKQGGEHAYLVNGPERIEVPVLIRKDGELLLEMPHYDSRIRARAQGDDRYVGTWEKVRGQRNVAKVPFTAVRGAAPRFPFRDSGASTASVDGRWAVDFASDELPAVGVFAQERGSKEVLGTFQTATGDYRFLAGSVDGNELRLSCFDGAHAFLFKAHLEDGALRGTFDSGNWWEESWSARRDEAAALGDPFAQTSWIERVSFGELAFPDLTGRMRSLAEPEFAGKATLVQLFGSWCPNCHDETQYLVELHERYAEQGLSILGLAFELTGEFERDREQVEIFAQRYGIEYPLFLAGTSDKGLATQAFGAIDRLRSYPTTIFVAGDGSIRAVHSGWIGPASPKEHAALRKEFESLVEELLRAPSGAEALRKRLNGTEWETPLLKKPYLLAFGAEPSGDLIYGTMPKGAMDYDWGKQASIRGATVTLEEGVLAVDARANVLLNPLSFEDRWVEIGSSVAPILETLEGEGEARTLAALTHEEPLFRREALVDLADRRARVEAAGIPEALALFEDESLEVRIAAAWAAGHVGDTSAKSPLLALIEHPHPALRREAVFALLKLAQRDASILLRLNPARDDPIQAVREAVSSALAEDTPADY